MSKLLERSIFVLGAADLEMNAIEALLKAAADRGQIGGYAFAVVDGKRVNPGNAYKAQNCDPYPKDHARIIEVECHMVPECEQYSYGIRIDHHRPGDKGFGKPAKDSLKASSLGQVLEMLGLQPTGTMLAIAAADHNLTAAYAGKVPGVSAENVFAVRLPELMARNRATSDEVKAGIQTTLELLKKAPRLRIGKRYVADIRAQGVLPYAVEAATMSGIEFIGRVDTRDKNKVLLSAKASTVAAFLAKPPEGITNIYGDPARGFAGGTE
jgi:hypothetical protein